MRLREQASGISEFYLQKSDSFTAICHISFDRRRQAPYVDDSCPTSPSPKTRRSENNVFIHALYHPAYQFAPL